MGGNAEMDKTSQHFAPAANNMDKYNAYQENFKKYNTAMKHEFYLEALWILYAMAEDRTSAFLYHLGFTNGKVRSKVCKRISEDARSIFRIEKGRNYGLDSLGGKTRNIMALLEWVQTETQENESDFKKAVREKFSAFGELSVLRETVSKLDAWRGKRNELAHGLLTKDYAVVSQHLKTLVEDAHKTVRDFDGAVRKIKKGKNIRTKLNLQ